MREDARECEDGRGGHGSQRASTAIAHVAKAPLESHDGHCHPDERVPAERAEEERQEKRRRRKPRRRGSDPRDPSAVVGVPEWKLMKLRDRKAGGFLEEGEVLGIAEVIE